MVRMDDHSRGCWNFNAARCKCDKKVGVHAKRPNVHCAHSKISHAPSESFCVGEARSIWRWSLGCAEQSLSREGDRLGSTTFLQSTNGAVSPTFGIAEHQRNKIRSSVLRSRMRSRNPC